MLSPHHMVHAMCLVVIAFLLKKNSELRTVHDDLRAQKKQLKATYSSGNSHDSSLYQSHDAVGKVDGACHCPCPCQAGAALTQAQSEMSTHARLNLPSKNSGNTRSATERDMFSDAYNRPEVPVDDFGRSMDPVADDGAGRREDSQIVVASQKSQFSHVNPPPAPMQPSLNALASSAETSASQSAVARQPVDGRTEVREVTPVDLMQTSESLEIIKPSPSSFFSRDNAKSSSGAKDADKAAQSGSENHNDFYSGSGFAQEEGTGEVKVIVTSVDSRSEGFLPHGVSIPLAGYDEDDESDYYPSDEEWEEGEKEEKPHPSFGKVGLTWLDQAGVDGLSEDGSHGECVGDTLSHRTCHFKNLCVNPQTKDFLFLERAGRQYPQVPDIAPGHPLLELSTVAGHNAKLFTMRRIPSTDTKRYKIAVLGSTLIFKRFKPDNIMHVLHDDIIPLFHTLLSHGLSPDSDTEHFPLSLFLADENSEGEFFDLYEAFSNRTFTSESLAVSTTKAEDSQRDSLVCFSTAYVGLSKTTTWYQYGFFKPQGVIADSGVKSDQLHGASSYLLHRLATECPFCSAAGDGGGHLVLISRKETRRILNEMDLVMAISRELKVKVLTVSLETHSVGAIISIVHSSRGLIGMHGSLLSLASFLPQGSVLLELFPFAVPPESYLPYRRLCEAPGMLIGYRAWSNPDRSMSVPHPDWGAELGGIRHLPLQQQHAILAQTGVPPHLCCEDPSWLYHIFQDTRVHIPQLLRLLAQAMDDAEPWRLLGPVPHPKTKMPGPPRHLECSVRESDSGGSLHLSWAPPWNAGMFGEGRVTYTLLFQDSVPGGRHVEVGRVDALSYTMEGLAASEVTHHYRVWVVGVVDGATRGSFAAVEVCSVKAHLPNRRTHHGES